MQVKTNKGGFRFKLGADLIVTGVPSMIARPNFRLFISNK